MSYRIKDIQGIGPSYGAKLSAVGVTTTYQLLERCSSTSGRTELSKESGFSTAQLLDWANMADLMRVNGVGPQFAELLKAAGVDTVKELGTRNAANLFASVDKVNDEKNLARSTPSEGRVKNWIDAAKEMRATIQY